MSVETGVRSPTRPGALFGRYEALAKLGEGGMGQVLLARARGEAGFQRLFALKVIGARGEPDAHVRTLLNEAKMAARIQHRNVVGVLDVGSYPEGHFLVMEYVEGCTLSELQRRRRDARPPRLVLPIVIDALLGLHAAHSITDDAGAPLHLIHADVTPQNLLVGVDGACRVTDFGLARVRDAAASGKVKGTPGYMSPEQVTGERLDLRSDIFSAGVVLWNALTGKKLFHGASDHASMYHVLKRTIPRPSTVGLAPPAALDALVLKALERDPARRFQSAEEMAMALREVAMRSGELGSARDVGDWITSTFAADLEARRRTIRELTDQHRVARIEGDRPSLSAISATLPRFETLNGSLDTTEHLSVEDLSLESDEIDVGDQLLPAAEVASTPPVDKSRGRALPIMLGFLGAATVLLGAMLAIKTLTAKPAPPPAPAPAPALAAPVPVPVPAPAPVVEVTPDAAPPAVVPEPSVVTEPPVAPEPAVVAEPVPAVVETAPPSHPTKRVRDRASPAVPPSPTAAPPSRPEPPTPPSSDRPELETNPYLVK